MVLPLPSSHRCVSRLPARLRLRSYLSSLEHLHSMKWVAWQHQAVAYGSLICARSQHAFTSLLIHIPFQLTGLSAWPVAQIRRLGDEHSSCELFHPVVVSGVVVTILGTD